MNFKNIIKINEQPKLYESGTAVMWTDEYISEQLLAFHLDETIDLASRKRATIKNTVEWILTKIGNEQKTILDLGCGPGLYAEILAAAGHKVTGVDFSKRSIDYALNEAEKKNLKITYVNQNYIDLKLEDKYDVVIMIYADFGVLSPTDREKLLSNIGNILKPGGILIFDVLNDKNIDQKAVPKNWELTKKGFWKNKPYLVLSNSFLYSEEKVILYQHAVIDEDDNYNIYRFWTHFFNEDDLSSILSKHDFTNIGFFNDVLPESDLWNGDNVIFCVATKK